MDDIITTANKNKKNASTNKEFLSNKPNDRINDGKTTKYVSYKIYTIILICWTLYLWNILRVESERLNSETEPEEIEVYYTVADVGIVADERKRERAKPTATYIYKLKLKR